MEKKLEQLANDLMSLSKEDAQRLQIIIKAKLMPEVEKQRGLLQQQQNPAMAQMGRQQHKCQELLLKEILECRVY